MAGKTSDKSTKKKYIVIPLSQQSRKEGYAICNANSAMGAKKIPFEKPILLSDEEVSALKRQREPILVDKDINVHEIMDKHRISQAKANKLAQAIESDKSMGGQRITFTPKYHVSPA